MRLCSEHVHGEYVRNNGMCCAETFPFFFFLPPCIFVFCNYRMCCVCVCVCACVCVRARVMTEWSTGDVRLCSRVYCLLTHKPREGARERDTYLGGERLQVTEITRKINLAMYRHTCLKPPPPAAPLPAHTWTGSQFGTKSLSKLDV